jgi:acyl-CoA thioesterase
METLFELIQKDQFAKYNNIELLEIGEGTATARMVVNENHLNAVGIIQGGALFTLADFVFAAASNSRGKEAVTLDANVNFIKAVSSGVLTAVASEIALKRTIGIYRVEISNEKNELIAIFQSTAYRKDPKPEIG